MMLGLNLGPLCLRGMQAARMTSSNIFRSMSSSTDNVGEIHATNPYE
jgi:hypothetical protein